MPSFWRPKTPQQIRNDHSGSSKHRPSWSPVTHWSGPQLENICFFFQQLAEPIVETEQYPVVSWMLTVESQCVCDFFSWITDEPMARDACPLFHLVGGKRCCTQRQGLVCISGCHTVSSWQTMACVEVDTKHSWSMGVEPRTKKPGPTDQLCM